MLLKRIVMNIYTSVFCLVEDFFGHDIEQDPDYRDFLYCFLFCEYDEVFLYELQKMQLIELIVRGCPSIDIDLIYEKLDKFIKLLITMRNYNLICFAHKLRFRFPWQEKTFVATTWEEYEDFFYDRVGVPIEFDHSCPPYFTLQLQLKEVDVGFVLK
jgi:hypothetical protein